MEIVKLFWAIRGLVYKPFMKKFGSKSYLGKPIIIVGRKNISIGNRVRIYPHIRLEAYGGYSTNP